jgi:hypothetical protein
MTNLSQGVQILIERLKTHPEDFFGELSSSRATLQMGKYTTKFRPEQLQIERHIIGAADKDDGSYDAYWFLTQEEKDALRVAYTEAKRARFEAEIIHTMMAPPEPAYGTVSGNYAQSLGASVNVVQQGVTSSLRSAFDTASQEQFAETGPQTLAIQTKNRYNLS